MVPCVKFRLVMRAEFSVSSSVNSQNAVFPPCVENHFHFQIEFRRGRRGRGQSESLLNGKIYGKPPASLHWVIDIERRPE